MESDHDLSIWHAESGGAAIRCQYCGATHNSRGKPMDTAALNQHLRKMHPHHFEEARPDGTLICDLCEKWKSSSGAPFLSEADLARHRAFCVRNAGKRGASRSGSQGDDAIGRLRPPARSKPSSEGYPGNAPLVSFCPQCGCNLHVVSAALSFVGNSSP